MCGVEKEPETKAPPASGNAVWCFISVGTLGSALWVRARLCQHDPKLLKDGDSEFYLLNSEEAQGRACHRRARVTVRWVPGGLAQAGHPAAMTRAMSGTGARSPGGGEMSHPALKSQLESAWCHRCGASRVDVRPPAGMGAVRVHRHHMHVTAGSLQMVKRGVTKDGSPS